MKLPWKSVYFKKKFELFSYKIFPSIKDWIDLLVYMLKPFKINKGRKKILGIMNFSKNPFGLGDAIYFQAILSSLKERHEADKIDICIVNDPRLLNDSWGKNLGAINHQIKLRLQSNALNPQVDNIFHFDHYNDFNRFRINNLHKYIHFPSRRDQLPADFRPLIKHYQIYNKLPELSVNTDLMKWAYSIIEKYIYPSKLIVVQIRNSMGLKDSKEFPNAIKGKKGAALRNSNLPEWEKFFQNIDQDKYKVICVSEKDEIVTKWCENNLVLFSKNLGSDFLKDCALIQASYLSLYPPSGLAAFAKFSQSPSVVYNSPIIDYHASKSKGIFALNHPTDLLPDFLYQDPYQKVVFEKDTFDTINYHFNELVDKLNSKSYNEEYHIKN
jgi:hypothetical protein